MAYGDFKNITRRTASEKILHDKAFSIAKNPKCDGYQRELPSMIYTFSIKCSLCFQINLVLLVLLKMKICHIKNYQKDHTNQLLENLRKEKYTHRVVDLADMQLISKFSKGIPSYYVLLTFSENTHGLLL